jgi:DNA-binding CsgD family transcriptional regulator
MEASFSAGAICSRETARAAPGIALSKREQQVLHWAAEGSEWGIGLILGLSEHTVEKFIQSARIKLPRCEANACRVAKPSDCALSPQIRLLPALAAIRKRRAVAAFASIVVVPRYSPWDPVYQTKQGTRCVLCEVPPGVLFFQLCRISHHLVSRCGAEKCHRRRTHSPACRSII